MKHNNINVLANCAGFKVTCSQVHCQADQPQHSSGPYTLRQYAFVPTFRCKDSITVFDVRIYIRLLRPSINNLLLKTWSRISWTSGWAFSNSHQVYHYTVWSHDALPVLQHTTVVLKLHTLGWTLFMFRHVCSFYGNSDMLIVMILLPPVKFCRARRL